MFRFTNYKTRCPRCGTKAYLCLKEREKQSQWTKCFSCARSQGKLNCLRIKGRDRPFNVKLRSLWANNPKRKAT